MTLPHQTGLVRDVSPRPDSVDAAEAHARGHGYWSAGRIEWTPRNLISLVLVVLGGVGAVAGVVVSVWTSAPSAYSIDTTTPRGTLGAYFEALSEGDQQRAADLICRRHRQLLIASGFLEATGTAVRRAPLEPSPVLMWDAERDGDDFLVLAMDGKGNSSYFRVVEEGDGTYGVCGFAEAG